MARKQFQTLSEPMYYILLALTSECCGVDIMKKVEEISKGRISVGPGTLYTLLGKFESSDLIRETEVQGRKRSYIITKQGYEALNQEYIRLKSMVNEGAEYIIAYQHWGVMNSVTVRNVRETWNIARIIYIRISM